MPPSRGGHHQGVGQINPQMSGPRVGMPGQMPPVMYQGNLVMQDWQMPQLQPQQQFVQGNGQHIQPMGTMMDGQYYFMQPGMMNHQFMGFDPSQHLGFPIAPNEMQQQFYQAQFPQFMSQ